MIGSTEQASFDEFQETFFSRSIGKSQSIHPRDVLPVNPLVNLNQFTNPLFYNRKPTTKSKGSAGAWRWFCCLVPSTAPTSFVCSC
mmetsp:Transcript_26096/g.39087  ORF Transcript_26096/g.39087 Transcript_26096/m.39087 type:complete len:86 (-) Transcript_26096:97-354(-)